MTQTSLINANITQQIRVRGLVQGVGFRPTVYRIAQQLGIHGEVINDGEGVLIVAQADDQQIDNFIHQLYQQKPPLAVIEAVERETLAADQDYIDFTIQHSQAGDVHTGIIADAATCPECLVDINDSDNRRYGYPFTNCTHCGPRLSIVHNIPYDRQFTSMQQFTQCAHCQQEYDTPEDRRFHAQPNACTDCGPVLQLTDNRGNPVVSKDIIKSCAELIQQGYIVAIKGIGGFQLACDAGNDATVNKLRSRKHRPHKSFAMMAPDVNQISKYCRVSETEKELLQSHAAPIVILNQKKSTTRLSGSIAPAQNTLGFMLPYSPLHHLLMQQLERPIVLTSGNAAEEPQCIDNDQALQSLSSIADYFVLHNRDIVNRVDDSVLRVINNNATFYRRARGYAPEPIGLPEGFARDNSILACGGELKNTFCLLKDRQAILSQHMGNLENVETLDDYLKNLDLYQRLFQFEPKAIVIDKHPEYLSSKYGAQYADEKGLPLIEVQHHHAHIAACLIDNNWSLAQGKVIGAAMDGLGFGDDGTIWGGEFLLADYQKYTRLARFKPVAMPGGTKAILEPWRNTYAQLATHCDWQALEQQFPQLELMYELQQKPLDVVNRMMESNINSPLTSSCGRLFDAVAGALGLSREQISYEGQAAIELEARVNPQDLISATPYPFVLEQNEVLEINPQPMWQSLLSDLQNRKSISLIAARFHLCLAEIISKTVEHISQQTGIKTIALSGGVFQNPTLFQLTLKNLKQQDLKVLFHQKVPTNDGGLALGQAAIAYTQIQTEDR